jgi:hypothetical protein
MGTFAQAEKRLPKPGRYGTLRPDPQQTKLCLPAADGSFAVPCRSFGSCVASRALTHNGCAVTSFWERTTASVTGPVGG